MAQLLWKLETVNMSAKHAAASWTAEVNHLGLSAPECCTAAVQGADSGTAKDAESVGALTKADQSGHLTMKEPILAAIKWIDIFI